MTQQDIPLASGLSATLDVVMTLTPIEESVTVSGKAPVIDGTSTVTTTRLTRETLEPSRRLETAWSRCCHAEGARGA
jgi:hypothetical protein